MLYIPISQFLSKKQKLKTKMCKCQEKLEKRWEERDVLARKLQKESPWAIDDGGLWFDPRGDNDILCGKCKKNLINDI